MPSTATTARAGGLCSVTLRARSIAEVVDAAVGAGLAAIEWGGDVHVPPGDLQAAAEARRCSAGRRPGGRVLRLVPVRARRRSVATSTPCSTPPRRWAPPSCGCGARSGSNRARRPTARAEVADGGGDGRRGRGRDAGPRRVPRVPRRHAHRVGARRRSTCSTRSARPTCSPPGSRPTGRRRTVDADLADLRRFGPAWPTCTSTSGIPTAVAIRSPTGEAAWPTRLAAASPRDPRVGAGSPPHPSSGGRRCWSSSTDDDPAALAADAATLRALAAPSSTPSPDAARTSD